jgi:hypothetical protein
MAATVEAAVKRIVTASVNPKIMRRVVMMARMCGFVGRDKGRWGRITSIEDMAHVAV